MAIFEYIHWLAHWLMTKKEFEFEWDRNNVVKIATKHEIGTTDIESVFRSRACAALGLQVEPFIEDEVRFGILGPAISGRILMIAFTLRAGRVRVISARPANRRERTTYEKVRKAT